MAAIKLIVQTGSCRTRETGEAISSFKSTATRNKFTTEFLDVNMDRVGSDMRVLLVQVGHEMERKRL